MPAESEDPLAPFRAELRAHCYRMLGSSHDAEDVLQEVSLRAWRSSGGFQGRASRRTWLYRIATNACLNELERKERRVLPVDWGPGTDASVASFAPVDGVAWIQPLPDDPQQRAADRESLELAFVAAVQHLSPNQRVALLMFDVLGFSNREIAEMMETTTASVRSALQRARHTVAQLLPERTQQATISALGDEGQERLISRYTAALRQHDVDGMLALLTEDATWSMPPMPAWFQGHQAIADFLLAAPFNVRWRHRPARANGQLAVGCYAFDEPTRTFTAYGLDVLDLRGDRIASVVSFIDGGRFGSFGLPPTLTD
ncbi:sigma-70 family RNA polymerase sigma factor [Solirubrobacter taibaiensis]|nr:sigma-70 family RNA polymerase sigma factor [Solirubrobacter taibaiensis]